MIREETNNVRLKINLDGGVEGDKQIIKSKTYNRVKKDATSDALYAVGSAISGMQTLPLLTVQRLAEVTLINE